MPVPIAAAPPAPVPAVVATAPPQVMAPAEVMVAKDLFHPPSILEEIVGTQMNCQG